MMDKVGLEVEVADADVEAEVEARGGSTEEEVEATGCEDSIDRGRAVDGLRIHVSLLCRIQMRMIATHTCRR
jgi:hypothetical protein